MRKLLFCLILAGLGSSLRAQNVYTYPAVQDFIHRNMVPGIFPYTQHDSIFFRRDSLGFFTSRQRLYNGRCSSRYEATGSYSDTIISYSVNCDSSHVYAREIFYRNWGYVDSVVLELSEPSGWERETFHQFWYNNQDQMVMIYAEDYYHDGTVNDRDWFRIYRADDFLIDSVYTTANNELEYIDYYHYSQGQLDSIESILPWFPNHIKNSNTRFIWHPFIDEVRTETYSRYWHQGHWQDTLIWESLYSMRTGLAVDEFSETDSGLKIYPNPAQDFVKIEGLDHEEGYGIYCLSGTKIRSGSTKDRIDLPGLEAGCYVLRIRGASMKLLVR